MGADPHLHANQLPSFWYEVAVSLNSQAFAGVSVPGVPGLVFGRNRNVSWSMTFGMVDNVDLMVDEVRGMRYRTTVEGEWLPVTVEEHIVLRTRIAAPPLVVRSYRAGRAMLDHVCVVHKEPQHSPLPGYDVCMDALPDGYYLSTLWTSDSFADASVFSSAASCVSFPSLLTCRPDAIPARSCV